MSEVVHTRRVLILRPDRFDHLHPELLSYCTGCLHYQMGDLATVMAMWAQHLEDVEASR